MLEFCFGCHANGNPIRLRKNVREGRFAMRFAANHHFRRVALVLLRLVPNLSSQSQFPDCI
jgi:hypothetical protein